MTPKTNFGVMLDGPVREALEARAKADDITAGEVVRRALTIYLDTPAICFTGFRGDFRTRVTDALDEIANTEKIKTGRDPQERLRKKQILALAQARLDLFLAANSLAPEPGTAEAVVREAKAMAPDKGRQLIKAILSHFDFQRGLNLGDQEVAGAIATVVSPLTDSERRFLEMETEILQRGLEEINDK